MTNSSSLTKGIAAKLFFVVLVLTYTQLNAQLSNSLKLFQEHLYQSKNIDSVLYYAGELANKRVVNYKSIIHESFVQSFFITGMSKDSGFAKNLLLRMMKDSNKVVVETAAPINYLVKAQENRAKPDELKIVAQEYLDNLLKKSTGYPDRIERYALIIRQMLVNEKECEEIAAKLLECTMDNLARYLQDTTKINKSLRGEERAYNRYLFAYCNNILAEASLKKGNKSAAARYYETASDFSPDERDKNFNTGYFYEMHLLSEKNPIESFKDNYLAFLMAGEDKTGTLRVMTEKAVTEPSYIKDLKEFYTKNYRNGVPFDKYWEREFNKMLNDAVPFSLKQLDGKTFTLNNFKGKWVLIDFWGTWCTPCVEELPKMEKFFSDVKAKYKDRIELITIACMDNEIIVNAFMEKNKYTFPVVIADNKIEKDYKIAGYPTKVLITPQGKYLKIPFTDDWVAKIKLYCGM